MADKQIPPLQLRQGRTAGLRPHPAAVPADEGNCVSMTPGERAMIRQAINCDMCGAERVEPTSHWFVADEIGGELRLRGWESPKGARKNRKHLCGQKCVQRLMDNFTASIMAGGQVKQQTREAAAPVVPVEKKESFPAPVRDRDDMPILERMGYDRETIAMVEAESWAGPARPKDNSWGAGERGTIGQQDVVNAVRVKSPSVRPFQRSA
jgi:hypothetical protein